jgi:nucleoside-diphosphate-sugar epimerase
LIYITGATGFIGAHIYSALVECQLPTVVLGRSYANEAGFGYFDFEFLDSISRLPKFMPGSVLIHAAWNVDYPTFWEDKKNINCETGSKLLFEKFFHDGGRKIIFVSSSAELSHPSSLYGRSKKNVSVALEEITRNLNRQYNILRLYYPIGPGEPSSKVISLLRSALVDTGEAKPLINGNACIDFVRVEDVAAAVLTALVSRVNGYVDICLNEPVSLFEVGRFLLAKRGLGNAVGDLGLVDGPCSRVEVGDNRQLLSMGWLPGFRGMERFIW